MSNSSNKLRGRLVGTGEKPRTGYRDHYFVKPSNNLSPRQLEILQLRAAGLYNREVAQKLGITNSTVKNTLTVILRKLDTDSSMRAVLAARKLGILK